MASQRYFSDDATLTVEDNAGSPSTIPVASLKGLTIELTADHVELFSGDSIEREAVKKRQAEVPVEISVAAFDVTLMQGWMAGDSTTTATSLTDTSDVAEYRVKGTFAPVDSTGNTIECQVTGVYFESMPLFDSAEGEYIVKDLSGTGKTISNLDTAP